MPHRGEEREMIPKAIVDEAARTGYGVWAQVSYEPTAREIAARLSAETPMSDPSIGLLPDDTWVVWYRQRRER